MTPLSRRRSAMSQTPDLRAATVDELVETLSFALRYEGRRRVRHADEMMARITADRLVQHLEAVGFVVMHKPSPQWRRRRRECQHRAASHERHVRPAHQLPKPLNP